MSIEVGDFLLDHSGGSLTVRRKDTKVQVTVVSIRKGVTVTAYHDRNKTTVREGIDFSELIAEDQEK